MCRAFSKPEWRLLGITILLPLFFSTYFVKEALAEIPPPYYDCCGNEISPEEYGNLLDKFDLLGGPEGVITQAFATPFGECDEGLLSFELDWEPEIALYTDWRPLDDGYEPYIVEYCVPDQVITGHRYGPFADPEEYSIEVLDYFHSAAEETFEIEDIGTVNGRIGYVFGWLDGPSGSVAVEAVLYIYEHATLDQAIFMQLNGKLDQEMLDALQHKRQIRDQCIDEAGDFGRLGSGDGVSGEGSNCDSECLTRCLAAARNTWNTRIKNAEQSYDSCQKAAATTVLIATAACLATYWWLGMGAAVACTIALAAMAAGLLGACYYSYRSDISNANNLYENDRMNCYLTCCTDVPMEQFTRMMTAVMCIP